LCILSVGQYNLAITMADIYGMNPNHYQVCIG